MRNSGKHLSFLALGLIMLLSCQVWAADFDYAQFRRECGLRLAYGKSISRTDVKHYTLLPRWGFFLVSPGSWLAGLGISVVAEGAIGIAEAEDTGWEFGLTPLLKLSFPLGTKALIFIEGGAGFIWENFDSPATPHTFNFTPQVGGGVDIALTGKLALSLAYRFRHSSNAGLYKNNPDFNVHLLQMGLIYYH
ncbi:MAG: acyloxyacyl hydrolase [Deltaproteobacteria bacterium]|nr:acyloxyacyl hydrolase [Deltaproteobacteria bacterium]